jgi:hypothetical protein
MQLKLLLPDNKENWREYRPDDILHGKQRFRQLKLCKEYQIKKHSRRRPASQISAKALCPGSPLKTLNTGPSPYYNPSRHYEYLSSSVLAAHTTLSQWPDENTVQNRFLSKEQSPEIPPIDIYSDKEVVVNEKPVLSTESASSDSFASHSRANSSETRPSVDEILAWSEPMEGKWGTLTEAKISSCESSTFKRSHSKVSSIGSTRSFSSRVSSKLSRPLSFVNSVISTDSWRSSLMHSMSMSSGRVSNLSDLPWSNEEMESWNELVDESLLAPNSTSPSRREADLLQHRPCCSFFEKDSLDETRSLCHICGFSLAHYDARSSQWLAGSQRSWAEVDRFGNTSLHHAAAAGNVLNVMNLLTRIRQLKTPSDSYLNHRNTAGETFLHVIQIQDPNDHEKFVDILKEASSLGFDFHTVDHRGRPIIEKIGGLLEGCKGYPSTLSDIADLLGFEYSFIEKALTSPGDGSMSTSGNPSGNFLQNIKTDPSLRPEAYLKKPNQGRLGILKNALGYSWLKRSKLFHNHIYDLDSNGETKLTASLKKWETEPLSRTPLERLIKKSDIEMRDRRGYTALAIAAGEGIRHAVSSLLKHGANPNSRSYRGTSVMAYAGWKLAQAQKEDRGELYSSILACMVLLNDNGAKSIVNLYEEYTMPTHLPEGKRKSVRTTLSKSQLSTALDTIEEDIGDIDETDTSKNVEQRYAQETQLLHNIPFGPQEVGILPISEMDGKSLRALDYTAHFELDTNSPIAFQAATVELPSSSVGMHRNFEKFFQDSECMLMEPEGIVWDGEKAFSTMLDTSLGVSGHNSRLSTFETSMSSWEPSSCAISTDNSWLSNFEKFFQDSDVISMEPEEMTEKDEKTFSSMLDTSLAVSGQPSGLSTFQRPSSSLDPSRCAISADNSCLSTFERLSSTFFSSSPSTSAPSSRLAPLGITMGALDSPLSLPGSDSHWLSQSTGHISAVTICTSKPISSSYVSNGIAGRAGHTFTCSCGFVPQSPQTKTAHHRKIKPNNGLTRNKRKRLKPPTGKETLTCESVPRCSPVNTAEDKWSPTSDLNKPQPTPSSYPACKNPTCKQV